MSQVRALRNYFKERYADAPGGQPHNDPSVPFEHLANYSGKQVTMHIAGPFLLSATGSFRHDPTNGVGVVWDGGDIFMSKETLGSIAWDEAEKVYQCRGNAMNIVIKPQE